MPKDALVTLIASLARRYVKLIFLFQAHNYSHLIKNLFTTLDAITKPTLLICFACYSKKIIFQLDRDHKLVCPITLYHVCMQLTQFQDNFLKIWDDGVDMGETCNWGVVLPDTTEPFEMGMVQIICKYIQHTKLHKELNCCSGSLMCFMMRKRIEKCTQTLSHTEK